MGTTWIITRTVGLQTDLVSIAADGIGGEAVIANDAVDSETLVGVTSNERVVFMRSTGGQTDLYAINADGTGGEIPLGVTGDAEVIGGIF